MRTNLKLGLVLATLLSTGAQADNIMKRVIDKMNSNDKLTTVSARIKSNDKLATVVAQISSNDKLISVIKEIEASLDSVCLDPNIIENIHATRMEKIFGTRVLGVARMSCRSFVTPLGEGGGQFRQSVVSVDINYRIKYNKSVKIDDIKVGTAREDIFSDDVTYVEQENQKLHDILESRTK